MAYTNVLVDTAMEECPPAPISAVHYGSLVVSRVSGGLQLLLMSDS